MRFSCNQIKLASGSHTLTLKAYDHSGRLVQKSITILVSNTEFLCPTNIPDFLLPVQPNMPLLDPKSNQ